MPEGPEVAIVARQLNKLLSGYKVQFKYLQYDRFNTKRDGGFIKKISSHGKWIFIHFKNGDFLRVNLGMSGKFVIGKEAPLHTKWYISEELHKIYYVDPRGFGHLHLVESSEFPNFEELYKNGGIIPEFKLGPDLLGKNMLNRTTSFKYWDYALGSTKPIKVALMDQSKLAGLGNIYASELCFLASVSPFKPANKISDKAFDLITYRCSSMLHKSVEDGGTSFGDANTYRDLYGVEGKNSKNLYVYGRDGSKCLVCEGIIQKSVLAGRSTYFCKFCQST